MAENKRSAIWEYFTEIEGGRRATYAECSINISRGGSGKFAANTSMINHLKTHARSYQQFREKKTERKGSKPKNDSSQPTITESLAASAKWDINLPEAKDITNAEMIVLDHQPVSMVEDQGFLRLMAKLLPKYQVIYLISLIKLEINTGFFY